MRSYEDRLDHIRAKVKTTKMAYTAIGLSVTTLCVFALVVCGLFVWPGLLFGGVREPNHGPVLQSPTNREEPGDTLPPWYTRPTQDTPTGPDVMEPTLPPPNEEQPTEPRVEIAFQQTNLNCYSCAEYNWGPVIIHSKEELELLYEREMAQFDDWILQWNPLAPVREQINQYDDAFFEKQSLILLLKMESSGSNRVSVSDVFWVGDTVHLTIDRTLPPIGTGDVAYWYMFIETEEVLPEGTDVFVQYRVNGDTWQEPASEWKELTISTETVYYGAPDTDVKYPRVDVIASVAELQEYLSNLEQDLSAETAGYDDTFFENHTLLALWNPVGSSSEKYNVTEVWRMSDGGVNIRCQRNAPDVCDDDLMSWLIFIQSVEPISHYAKITVVYETIEAAIPPARPENTNLEFWIGEDVADVDFSAYDEVYGWFGAREFLGKGYQMLLDEHNQQQYPQTYVSYIIGAFPDESDGGSFVTGIEIRDTDIVVYGLTIQSDVEEFEAVFRAMGYGIYEANGTWKAIKNGITFTFRKGECLLIHADITNREGIIY